MKCSRRDLRAIDIFALLLIGIGVLFLALGALRYIANPRIEATVSYKLKGAKFETMETSIRSGETVQTANWPAIRTGLFGTVFTLLGTTMNLGLRRIMRNGKTDVDQQAVSERL